MRARDIKPGFFLNEYLAACSPHARLLFIGLWMLADREGRLEERPKQIKAKIFPFENVDLEGLLEELAKSPEGDHPFIQRYEVKGKSYIQVVNFLKHQSPHPKERPSEIPPPPELTAENREKSLTSREISRQVSDNYRKLSDRQVANHSDILIPDSLTPDILTPYSLIADSLKEASPKGEAQMLLRAPPSPGEQKRTQETAPQPEEAFSEVPPPGSEETPLGVPPPQPEEAFLGVPPPERARPSQPTRPPQPDKAQRSLRSPPHPAVEAYKRAFFYYPRRNLYSLIAQKVGEDEEDLRLWFQACQSWAAHGWNPRNIAGLLEYYEKRDFEEKNTLSRGIPKFSKAAQVAIELAEKYEREERDEEDDEEKKKNSPEERDQGISSFFQAFALPPLSHPP